MCTSVSIIIGETKTLTPLIYAHLKIHVHRLEFNFLIRYSVWMSINIVLKRAKKFHRQPAVSWNILKNKITDANIVA